jgi:hypothetical protein
MEHAVWFAWHEISNEGAGGSLRLRKAALHPAAPHDEAQRPAR